MFVYATHTDHTGSYALLDDFSLHAFPVTDPAEVRARGAGGASPGGLMPRDSQLDPDLGACPRGHSCWGDAAMEERFDWLQAENASIRGNADQITYVTQARALHGALHASWAHLRVARPRS